MKKLSFVAFMAMASISLVAMAGAPLIKIVGTSAPKTTVTVNVANPAFAKSLAKNLELSGLFQVVPDGSIKVSGGSGAVVAEGAGKKLTSTTPFATDTQARMAARKLSDAMVNAYSDGKQKGFACDKIAFISRKSANQTELAMCYPDGYDIRQLTSTGLQVVGPRWKDANSLFYTGLYQAGPQIWEYDTSSSRKSLKWSFKGLSTGACVSPDGRRVAIILSFQGNPELYVINLGSDRWERLTNTPNVSEGQPSWSPDGSKIVYVSDATRHPQLYIVDVATKQSHRLTSDAGQSVDPDWGKDGRITYIKQGQVAVLDPAKGGSSAQLVTSAGKWSHPSWSRDGRHIVATRDRALFVVDTQQENPDAPRQVFSAQGTWESPSWSK